ncbi:MAG: chromosomal replication initiator protein DnaA [Bifidobacteriaceae bacterium]|jgi:chromosomal replication initiator protein|nr:chromosomal replication initiator protein DnaA [Bifidobacteriaceae bacterium]
MEASEIWRKAVDKLLKAQQLPPFFSVLLNQISAKSFENDHLILSIDNISSKQKMEANFSTHIINALNDITGKFISFSIEISPTPGNNSPLEKSNERKNSEYPDFGKNDYFQEIHTSFDITDNNESTGFDAPPTVTEILDKRSSEKTHEKTPEEVKLSENVFAEKHFQKSFDSNQQNPEPRSFFNNLQSSNTKLISRFRFDNFVTGEANTFAASAAAAVCDDPGIGYNPLLIHGESGMGKTHLLHAIGNEMARRYKDCKILYCTAEEFISDYTSSIREGNMHKFKDRYTDLDLLLIDDIQFFANKVGSQEQFVYVFNQLTNAGKQIAMCSDVHPDRLENISNRVITRMKGTVVGLGNAGFEMKSAILKSFAAETGQLVNQDAVYLVAKNHFNSIRELIGFYRTMINFLAFSGKDLSIESVQKYLAQNNKDKIIKKQKLSAPESIIKNICEFYNCSYEEVAGATRKKSVVYARNMAVFLLRKLTQLSLSEIGSNLGGRDHSTILNCYNKAEAIIKNDENAFKQIEVFLDLNKSQNHLN